MLPNMNIIRILIKITEWTIFTFLLVILFFVISPLLPTKQYISTYVIATGSMEPTIKTGSIVFTTSPKDIKVGDIVAFQSPNNSDDTIVHRINSVIDGGYTTKGDNNSAEDTWVVNSNQIKGKYIYSIPYVGNAIEWAKTPVGFVVVLIIPALLFAYTQYQKIREGIDDEVMKRIGDDQEE